VAVMVMVGAAVKQNEEVLLWKYEEVPLCS
jgi:hypothetical protein